MTEDEIFNVQPGRELDALVAEKVMNLCVLDHLQTYGDGCVLSDEGMDEWTRHPMYGKMEDPDLLEPYSTDISAAWEVVEKMKRTGWSINVTSWGDDDAMGEDPYLVTFGFQGGPNNFMSNNLSEAICKAALLAVMEDMPKASETTATAQ